ncbi:MAG: leucine-rich repeat protein [Ruminococcus sp.]|nr:leucine-rich repeat protein [Ruminococcus sp.]
MKVKKILTAVMCLCMTAQMSGYIQPAIKANANGNVVVEQPVKTEIYDIFQYKNLGNYIEIVATSSMAKGVIEVPAEIDGLPVKSAGEHAFAGNQNITEIKLPDTLTSIGKGAFQGDTKLQEVNIPEGVTAIKDETFLNCTSLMKVNFPKSLQSIGVRAFYNCDLRYNQGVILLSDNISKIGAQAFENCKYLRGVRFPKSLTVLEEGVFYGCENLLTLTIPETIEKISARSLPSGIKSFTVENPDCEIDRFAVMGDTSNIRITAEENSKVQAQAEEYGYTFEAFPLPVVVEGDANGDGHFGIADAITLQNWLMGNGTIENWQAVDFTGDGVIDVFDLCAMKQALVENHQFIIPPGLDIDDAVCLTAELQSEEVEGKEADEAFVNGQTSFALELFKNTIKENENVLVSPYSVVQALAMTGNGADGITKEEMENVIGGGIDFDELNKYLYTQRTGQPNNEKCKLLTANSVWTRDDEARIQVSSEFLQKVVDYYSAEVFKAPFDDTTVADINSWVDTNTDHMIPEIINELSDSDVMALINAVTFDAKWQSPYFKEDVWKRDFTNYNGTVQQADMMFSNEYYYLEDENATGFYKYYQGRRYAFAALLPNEDINVVDYVNSLTPESLHNILANPQEDYISAGLPKFSYDYGTELSKVLCDMGMPSAFVDNADFSKLAQTATGMLFIDRVIHKTHIDVFEEGTRAAAVTGVFMNDAACPAPPEKEVILDRPFVYCIVDTETSLPVFMGTLMNLE